MATYPMRSPSTYKPHQRPWRLSTSTRCPGRMTWTTGVSVPRPSLTFAQVDVHFVWVLGPAVLGVAIGGAVTVAGADCAGVLLVGGWNSLPILFGIPRMATNNSGIVTSNEIGQVMCFFFGAARWPKKREHRGHTDATLATFWPHSGQSMSGTGTQGG